MISYRQVLAPSSPFGGDAGAAAEAAAESEAGFCTPMAGGATDADADTDPFDLAQNRGPVGEVALPEDREVRRAPGRGGERNAPLNRERTRELERAAELVPLPYSTRSGGTPVLNVRLERSPPPKRSGEELATHALHHRAFRAGVLREEPRSAPVRTRPTHADNPVPAALQQPWSKDRVVEPSLFIDVEIGDGRVGQIAVREGSNSYALAKRFCSCHEIHVRHVEPLAEMVKGQVAAYCAAIERRKERASRAENRRKLLRWQQRFTTSVSHDVHAGLRVTKRAATRHAARAHDLSASSTPAESQVVGRLHIEIGGGQTGTLVVHTGCDARQLAYGFCAAHGLADGAAAQIEQQIERHLLEASVRQRWQRNACSGRRGARCQ